MLNAALVALRGTFSRLVDRVKQGLLKRLQVVTRWLLNTNHSFTSISSHLRVRKMRREMWPVLSKVIIPGQPLCCYCYWLRRERTLRVFW